MGRPVCRFGIHSQTGTGIFAFAELLHGDAVFNGTNTDTQVAANALFIFEDKLALAVDGTGNRLVGGIFTGNMALAAFNT